MHVPPEDELDDHECPFCSLSCHMKCHIRQSLSGKQVEVEVTARAKVTARAEVKTSNNRLCPLETS